MKEPLIFLSDSGATCNILNDQSYEMAKESVTSEEISKRLYL